MFGERKHASLEERVDDTFDSGIRKRRVSGVHDAEPEAHTRQTSRPPPSATADLLLLTRDDGTIPESPLNALLDADEHAAIEEARALYMQSQALPPGEFDELMALLGDVVEYGTFDPSAVPVLGLWSELAEICLEPRALMVLALADGERTVAQIVEQSGLTVNEAVAELQTLVDHGALEI